MQKPLTVYKASAGSGKTFTLATEYIKLLIENPQCYSKILAVTFTNKATEEMKMRILSHLYGIWKNLPDSKVYKSVVMKSLDNVSEKYVSDQAGKALSLLLHNFNYFRVETIDSFFQCVLRNLARELDLTPNLRIGLNDYQVEEQAVDSIIENLDNSSEMLQWLFSYIMENISDDKTWNVIWQIKKFGKTIFRDYYKDESKNLNIRLSEKNFLDNYIRQIREIRDKAKDTMTMYAESFFDALDNEGLKVENLKGGSRGISSYFNKLKSDDFSDDKCINVTMAAHLENPANWIKKSTKDGRNILNIVESTLYPVLKCAENVRSEQWKLYKSASATLRHISQLRLLNVIEKKVREMNDEAGRFLLSDTQQLLHELIDDSDSPFIFEKIGAKLEHIMIDEFQDTSIVQWQNFKILLYECMSHDYKNLIVGDVKQSIYRWRSGDWRLLNNIDKQFNGKQLDVLSLSTNYRSQRNIIQFNNYFFGSATAIQCRELSEKGNIKEAEQLERAYSDVIQSIPDNKAIAGLVRITMLSADNYEDKMICETLDTINYLISKDIDASKIAVLLRKNGNIVKTANYLSEHLEGVKIVSDEAFRLDASISVLILVQSLQLLAHPEDRLAKSFLVKALQKQILCNELSDNEIFVSDKAMDELLPESFILNFEKLKTISLYDLVEQLYKIFSLDKLPGQSAYICTFFDQISSFVSESSTDIDDFLEEWNNSICSKTIQSDELDGIRLITIHKSKGLEYDNVIVPFCDWNLDSRDTIWCEPNIEPFSQLPIVPIDCSAKNMMGTIYEKDYINESLQNTVDNLNLLYVAFTRAKNNLFVIGKKDTYANNRSQLIQATLESLINSMPGCTLKNNYNGDNLLFEYGSICIKEMIVGNTSKNVFLQETKPESIEIKSFDNPVGFRQSNKSIEFIENEEDDEEFSQNNYIQIGNILHHLFSTIRNINDIDPVLHQFQSEGLLYDESITKDKLSKMIGLRLKDKRVEDWFSPHWTVFNECSIISVDKETNEIIEKRPDRVITDGKQIIVIDFKFGKQNYKYQYQVKEYMNLLVGMGYKSIKGYIWYVYSNQINEIEL